MREVLLSPKELEQVSDENITKEYLKTLQGSGELTLLKGFVDELPEEKKEKGKNEIRNRK